MTCRNSNLLAPVAESIDLILSAQKQHEYNVSGLRFCQPRAGLRCVRSLSHSAQRETR